ncbi:lasso peptide biosynthesis B2 protein [Nonomuraea jiangxiensis]|uniref:Transglutaminase-like superfamily protein n=1 Tax=Nonomuraea jiangxiensis TaxID=633440 RepID=A0A1G9QUZ1_9ACTN|nr:lasso peptide biosynthesis B2 protein [Nonomuraea jiangxiensis]SDM14814.1 Transglutaminase-like superfamily protein [Nonomuraea jiangxiensis]
MSPKMVALQQAGAPPWRLRPVVLLTIALAWPLARLSPHRLSAVLRFLSRGARPATAAQAERARDAILGLSLRHGGPRCLERSIAIALMCRLGGGWPDWCTGVSTHPFEAHAWVEADGHAIGENPDEIAHFFITMKVSVSP